ncbi:hypothetical protein L596_028576 [Steinernema carpocapsae]|uniref:Uncharacterized protein n=1 Tax=Steinernema carpocapsae TaxID=34508 RepID=A0A4U5LYY3_STECR|nr:hypothetical protein L596_028576 [Steinernema carpocapsae]
MSLLFDIWFLAAVTCALILIYRPQIRRRFPLPQEKKIETVPESEVDTLADCLSEVAFPDKNPRILARLVAIRRRVVCNVM